MILNKIKQLGAKLIIDREEINIMHLIIFKFLFDAEIALPVKRKNRV